jgi:hypothetical protein
LLSVPKHCLFLFFATLFVPLSSLAQEQKEDSLKVKLKQVYDELEAVFNSPDTSSVVGIIDSFLTSSKPTDTSKLSIRVGYSSNLSALNQTLGIKQFGLSPGISYYHQSGLYADVSMYWSRQFIPPFYLSIFSAGYMKALSKSYLVNVEYSYFLYPNRGEGVSAPYTNSFNLANQIELKPLLLKLDYYYYFGSETAHRVIPSVAIVFEKTNWGKAKRLSFSPSFAIMFGTENSVNYVPLALTQQQILDRLKTGASLYTFETITVFGLMNYAFNFPLSLRSKRWVYQLGYTYNIPKSLPDEELTLTNTGYISASLARYIGLK